MTPSLVGVGALVVALAAGLTLGAQPDAVWRDGAEHSRRFWLMWLGGCVAIGLAGPLGTGLGWLGAGWLALWAAAGGLQPSMVADLVDVRRLACRRRRSTITTDPPGAPAPPPIRWRAPTVTPHQASWAPPTPG